MFLNVTSSTLENATKASSHLAKGGSQREIIFKVYLTRGVVAGPLALLTSFSNGLVILLFIKDPNRCIRASPTCLLVASLALVDFLVGCALEPTDAYYSLSIAYGKKPSIARKDMQSASAYLLLCSMLLVMLITVDRFMAVSRPLQYSQRITKKRVYTIVVFVCVYCAAVILVIRQWAEQYRNELFCGHIDLVLVITIALFGSIVCSLRKQTLKLKRLSVNSDDVFVVQASERERKVTLTLATMLVLFLACTMPWFLMMQVFDYCKICQKNWRTMKLLFILVQANCALNPLICTLRLPRYKVALKGFCPRLFPSTWRERYAFRLRKPSSNSYTPNGGVETKQSLLNLHFVKGSPILTQYQLKHKSTLL